MKRKIGKISILILVSTLFFSVILSHTPSTDKDLASLIALNVANAKRVQAFGCIYSGEDYDSCLHDGITVKRCYENVTGECWYEPPN